MYSRILGQSFFSVIKKIWWHRWHKAKNELKVGKMGSKVGKTGLEEKNDDRVPKTEYLPVNFLQFIDRDEMCGGKGEEVTLSLLRSDI